MNINSKHIVKPRADSLCFCCHKRPRAQRIQIGKWKRFKLCEHCMAQRKASAVNRAAPKRNMRPASCGYHGVEAFAVCGPAGMVLDRMNSEGGW